VTTDQARPRVTQRVPLADVDDLLTRPARAAVAYVGPDGPDCVPVVVRRDDGIRIGMDADAEPATGVPGRVALVVDDGRWWYELRAAVWRGTVTPESDDRTGRPGEDGLVWFRLDPARVVAWDYGCLHEEPA
jgi:hypothetical protein